jgi:hypothetical protein
MFFFFFNNDSYIFFLDGKAEISIYSHLKKTNSCTQGGALLLPLPRFSLLASASPLPRGRRA